MRTSFLNHPECGLQPIRVCAACVWLRLALAGKLIAFRTGDEFVDLFFQGEETVVRAHDHFDEIFNDVVAAMEAA